MPSWVWELCTLTQTLLFQQVHHPFPRSSTINFLRVESPFSIEDGPLWVVWRNYYLLGCIVVFSQLLRYFSKLLAWLMVLLQWRHFSFLIWGSQWYCLNIALFEQNLAYLFPFMFGLFNQTFHWLLNLLPLLISCCKHDLELIVG